MCAGGAMATATVIERLLPPGRMESGRGGISAGWFDPGGVC